MRNLLRLFFVLVLNFFYLNISFAEHVMKNVIIKHPDYGYCRVNINIVNGIINKIDIIDKQVKDFSASKSGNNFFVTPGFVNSHLHPNQLLDRRLLDGLDTHTLLSKMHINFDKTYEDRYMQALFVLIDAIKSGATTIYSVASNPTPVIDAYNKIGVKGAISCFFNDQWETQDTAPKVVDFGSIEKKFAEFITQKTDKLDIHIGTASIRSASNEMFMLLNNLAKKYNTKVNLHVSECEQDSILCKKTRGLTPIRLLESLGVLNSSWNLIHTVALDEEEIKILAKTGVSIIHCPVSNAKTATGIAPIKEMLNAGVNITLGTDACSNNNTNNILNEAYFASLLHAAKNKDAQRVTTDMLWQWLTTNAYKMLGRNQAGVIKEGEQADLLMWDLNNNVFVPQVYGNFDSSIFYNAPDIKPHTVIIDGEMVVENYKFIKFPELDVVDKINETGQKIYKKFFEEN
ncbi:MAG: 5-methylthioadenosine/S-adenosylhomocysteine deaminase [candidate division TM6 bacterium GW2011_GWF2_28_16]|nr:MAG: 5-methylthioadenosine/S-adenosylhomocysteine deaminase [candidate division TM6 bacterium GW2011_GWF2_28_16]